VGERKLLLDEKSRLCEALLQIRDVQEQNHRNTYVAELARHLGRPLSIDRDQDPRHDLLAVISACEPHPGALRAFVTILRAYKGGSTEILQVERVMDEIEYELIDSGSRDALVHLLLGVRTQLLAANARELLKTAADSAADLRDATVVVRRLEVMPAVDGEAPLLLTFVDQIAHRAEGVLRRSLHEWIDGAGTTLGLSQQQIRDLCTTTRQVSDQGRSVEPEAGPGEVAGNSDNPREANPSDPNPSQAGEDEVVRTSSAPPNAGPATSRDRTDSPRLIRGGLPIRNPDFTGRQGLLAQLRAALESKYTASVLPQTLHGLGGVGKTQLAVEYVFRYDKDYDLIWWIPSEDLSQVLSSLADLGERLGVRTSEDLKQTAGKVLNELSTTSLRWLLVFDNAEQLEEIRPLVPRSGGYVIVTSRNQEWARESDAIEVDVFERKESIDLVQRRGQGISAGDADRLAEKLGDLPLALDQAASWQATTGMPVREYLELFDHHVQELMEEGKPTAYPTTVAALVRVAFERIRAEAPVVAQLLELFAYLGAEPISVGLLHSGRTAQISEPLRQALGEPIDLRKTIRQLRRYGLAKVAPDQRIQVHRLVQLVLREGLDDQLREQSRVNVHSLLAAANPGEPDDPNTWPGHAEIGPHVLPSGIIEADSVQARRVALDQIRYLYVIGDYEGGRRLGERVVSAWRAASGKALGPDGELTLIATRHLANALRSLGEHDQARRLDEDTHDRLRRSPLFGEQHDHTLATAMSLGADLRLSGEYRQALALDQDNLERHRSAFDDEDPLTLRARSNLAVSMRMVGDFRGALEIDEDLVRKWQDVVGENDPRPLFCITNAARDQYGLGRYAEALEMQRRTLPVYRDLIGERHNNVLMAARTVAIALRKTGEYEKARGQARDNYLDYHDRFGPDHEHTLVATMSYANSLRAVGQLHEARGLATDAVDRYCRAFGMRHPLTLAAMTNRAIILRALGELKEARELDEVTLATMREVLGHEHPHTLCAATNLSNDLVLHHDLAGARALSEATLAVSRRVRGDDHPYTLACALNTGFDRQATGDAGDESLLNRTLATLDAVLGPDHPERIDAGRWKRAECDIEPPPS
jgi:hypothetical protein